MQIHLIGKPRLQREQQQLNGHQSVLCFIRLSTKSFTVRPICLFTVVIRSLTHTYYHRRRRKGGSRRVDHHPLLDTAKFLKKKWLDDMTTVRFLSPLLYICPKLQRQKCCPELGHSFLVKHLGEVELTFTRAPSLPSLSLIILSHSDFFVTY